MIAITQPFRQAREDNSGDADQADHSDYEDGYLLTLKFTNGEKKKYRQKMVERTPYSVYCGKKVTQENATLEHFIPQSAGGGHHPWNLFLACQSCNGERSSRDIPEWVAELRAKADRLEAAYRRMSGDLIETETIATRWPVSIAFPIQEATA